MGLLCGTEPRSNDARVSTTVQRLRAQLDALRAPTRGADEPVLDANIQMHLNVPALTSCASPGVDTIDVFRERSVATSEWKLVLPGEELLNIDKIGDIQIYFSHRWVLAAP